MAGVGRRVLIGYFKLNFKSYLLSHILLFWGTKYSFFFDKNNGVIFDFLLIGFQEISGYGAVHYRFYFIFQPRWSNSQKKSVEKIGSGFLVHRWSNCK